MFTEKKQLFLNAAERFLLAKSTSPVRENFNITSPGPGDWPHERNAMKKNPEYEKIVNAFLARIQIANDLALSIMGKIDNHLDADPDAITWGNVADAGRLVESLNEIAEYLGIEK